MPKRNLELQDRTTPSSLEDSDGAHGFGPHIDQRGQADHSGLHRARDPSPEGELAKAAQVCSLVANRKVLAVQATVTIYEDLVVDTECLFAVNVKC